MSLALVKPYEWRYSERWLEYRWGSDYLNLCAEGRASLVKSCREVVSKENWAYDQKPFYFSCQLCEEADDKEEIHLNLITDHRFSYERIKEQQGRSWVYEKQRGNFWEIADC